MRPPTIALQHHFYQLSIEELVTNGWSLAEEQLLQVMLEHVHDDGQSSKLME